MLLLMFLLIFEVNRTEQTEITLKPELSDILENGNVELTCYTHKNDDSTEWRNNKIQSGDYSILTYVEEGSCDIQGFLADVRYFETRCYSNATFKVIIKRVNISNHGQEWFCEYGFAKSNPALINVQVPTKYVKFKNVLGDVFMVVEKIKTTLTCETSEGRPAANIKWTKISKKGMTKDITHDLAYAVSRNETLTDRNMSIVRSSIDIEPVREDTGTRIICEATNRKSHVARKEITINVQYPPSRPIFFVNRKSVNGSLRLISGKKVLVLCVSDSYPSPTYFWTSTRISEYRDQYLNISKLDKSDTWQCTVTNDMTLPNKTTVYGNNSAKLQVHLLSPPTKPVLTWKGEEGKQIMNGTLYAVRNDDVTLTCHSNGEPAPNYEWIGHRTGPNLYIKSVETNTNKTCKASNEMIETFGEVRTISASTTVSIIVSYPPGIPYLESNGDVVIVTEGKSPRNKITIKENSTFTVNCKATGFPTPVCKWESKNTPDLTFTNIRKHDTGVYKCIAENNIIRSFPVNALKKKTSSTDLEIDVLYQSKIEMFYVNGHENSGRVPEVIENSTIVFKCSVDSNPESEITLFFGEKRLKRRLSTHSLSHTYKVTSCLDDGIYKCVAKNRYNTKPSIKELGLNVKCKPMMSPDFDLETNISSAQNLSVTFHFKAVAYPTSEFRWSKLSDSSWTNLKQNNKYIIKTAENYSNLTIIGIAEKDYGVYGLTIQNAIGTLIQTYFLKANGRPDPPTTFLHLNEHVTETTAVLQWTPGFDGGPHQTFILRYKLDLESDWVNVSIPDVGDKTMNYTLDDLESGSVYNTELYAVNTEGNSNTLNLTFKTKDFPTLTENSIHEWKYVIFSFGGVILILVVLVVAMVSRKRLKQRSSVSAIYQNVPLSVPESNNIYQNLPVNTQTDATENRRMIPKRKPAAVYENHEMTKSPKGNMVVNKDRPTRKSAVHEPHEMPELSQKKKELVPPNLQEIDNDNEELFSEPTEYYNTLEIIKRLEKIKVSELYDYVKSRSDDSFNADFQKIPTALQMPCTFARKPENIALNRYKGILPYNHTRVRIDDQPDFFINASYIDGYEGPKAYIACLGPTKATHDNFKTFWKMVWHDRSELIVMVTNLNEPSGMKCEQYWPDAIQDETYGDIRVLCQKIEKFAEFTFRRFEVTKTTVAGTVCRRLVHLHYTAWPDKNTPEDVTSLLEFRQKYTDIRKTVHGPVIVHCSAGIGRTGAFIAIDRLIMEGKNEGSVNVVACITKMREQRVKLVQTCDQFKFVFKAVTYALNFDCDPIQKEHMKEHFATSDKRSFTRKYKELEMSLEMKSKEQVESIAKNMNHKNKNRHGADIPDNNNRVYLHLNRRFEDSDYINAVFINSYKCKDHFIMAQSPLPGMESDFLTLIYQENCSCVVSMEDYTEKGLKIGKYLLKEKQVLNVGSFTVSCFVCDSKPQYTVRKLTIKNKELSRGDQDFYHFQYKKWSEESDTPTDVEDFVELVKDVQEYEKLGEDNSPVLVHCLNANERSGIFCVVAIIIEKLLYDGQVSVMNTLRHLRTRRSSAITSMEQLKFCYKAALVIAKMKKQEDMYINTC